MPKPVSFDKEFKCEYCQQSYTTKSNLTRHQRDTHKVNTSSPPVPRVRVPEPAPVAPKQLSDTDIAILIEKLRSGQITSLTDLTGLTRETPVTVKPTLDIGQLLVDMNGMDDDDVAETNQIINDHMLYHIQSNCDFQSVVDDILESHYDLVFLAVFKNQIYYNDGEGTGAFLTYLDGDRFGELNTSEENVGKLFKLICDAICYYYANLLCNLRVRFETADASDVMTEVDRINNLLCQITACRNVRGNGRIISDPRSELQSRPLTRSLGISYNKIREILHKFNVMLEISDE